MVKLIKHYAESKWRQWKLSRYDKFCQKHLDPDRYPNMDYHQKQAMSSHRKNNDLEKILVYMMNNDPSLERSLYYVCKELDLDFEELANTSNDRNVTSIHTVKWLTVRIKHPNTGYKTPSSPGVRRAVAGQAHDYMISLDCNDADDEYYDKLDRNRLARMDHIKDIIKKMRSEQEAKTIKVKTIIHILVVLIICIFCIIMFYLFGDAGIWRYLFLIGALASIFQYTHANK